MEKFNHLNKAMDQLRTKCEEMNEEATKLDQLINDLQKKRDEVCFFLTFCCLHG